MTTTPTIHLGGTSRDSLLEQVCLAKDATEAALAAVIRAYPNGRDYPMRHEALEAAKYEYNAILGQLRDAVAYFEARSIAIAG